MIGDRLELMTPSGNIQFTLEAMQDKKGQPMEVAPGDGYIVYLPIPKQIDIRYALLIRNLNGINSQSAQTNRDSDK